jgi:hypothetical protein
VAVGIVEETLAARAERGSHLSDDQLSALRAICDVERTGSHA